MPSIEMKSVDRLGKGDRLLFDAGPFAKAGTIVDERIIRHLGRHRVPVVPTLALSYEEQHKTEGKSEDELIRRFLDSQEDAWEHVRRRLYEKLKSSYVPFSENERQFQAPGKRKQITKGVLLEPRPERLYLADIDAGSHAILPESTVHYLRDGINTLYSMLSKLNVRSSETRGKKRRIPRVGFHTIRLQSLYDGERIATVGDAFVLHALDCCCYFLNTMVNINKKRILAGAPLTERRFDPGNKAQQDSLFQYSQEFIVDAALGVLIGFLGFFQEDIHYQVSVSSIIDGSSAAEKRCIKLLQRNILVLRNLLRDRHDISALTRMTALMQKVYADGTGFPPPNENRYLHEFVRLFQIIAVYDELTNPVIGHTGYSRMEVIGYLRRNSGPYRHDWERFTPQPRFDSGLLDEFLQILAPFRAGEKVYLYSRGKRSAYIFVGRVYTYSDDTMPLVSILKDERSGKSYPFGRLLIHIPSSSGFFMQNGKIIKRFRADWVGGLQIHDTAINPGDLGEYQDFLYGEALPLARGVKGSF
ncbi:hypothetical protein [Marispirochaeta aestuarii]|uniref:hypothetical protein n=1 Tax=Marispirochaeta aestuarii TaxID=1963862 RepID=UPI0029C98F6E|nr:hypothetical protein [Marispirochaeta aestuarii]